jgi:type IV pilus assembly protein PilW
MRNFSTKRQGFSLIELMIAMLLGILLLLSITSMFITNKRVYKEQESMSRLQENARFALETMIWDIRMAGYSGCSHDITDVVNHVNGGNNSQSIFNFSNAVEGSENNANWLPSGSTDQVANMVAGTDAITVSYLNPIGIGIAEAMPQVSAELKVTSVGNLVEGDIIAVSDCDSADIMEITQVQTSSLHLQHNAGGGAPAPGNATQPLQKKYDTDAQVVSFVSRRYYIGTGAYGGPSLFRTSNGTTPQELIEGVEQMQILYGVDTDSDKIADTYLTATNVPSWSNVVSVRLSLLFRTVEQNFQIDPDTKTYALLGGGTGGATVGPVKDYNRRRVFTTTIQIRNRTN